MSNDCVTRRYLLLPLVALLAGGPLAAQGTSATVSGQITDSSAQAPLAGAEVFIIPDGASPP